MWKICTMIDWENLHYFSVFSEEKTLSAAARKLGVTMLLLQEELPS